MPGKKKGGGGAAKGGAKGGKKGDPKAKEKKQKLLEERTFGLKNKNKSKKTQRMIDQMEKSLVGTKDNKSKKKEKDARKQEDLELKMLFKEAKKKDAGQQQQQQQEETEPEVREDDLPLEERIELQRQRLPKTGLTKVNAESFAKWKKRRQRRLKREREHAIANGLIEYVEPKSKFTGKELFTKDRSLFSLSDDKTSSAAASGAADDAGEAGAAGASADAATGVVAEENAALFLDEVELDDIEDDEEQPAAEGGAAAGATDAAAPAAAAAPASSS